MQVVNRSRDPCHLKKRNSWNRLRVDRTGTAERCSEWSAMPDVFALCFMCAERGRRIASGGSCSTTRRRASTTTTRPASAPSGTDRTTATLSRWPNCRCVVFFVVVFHCRIMNYECFCPKRKKNLARTARTKTNAGQMWSKCRRFDSIRNVFQGLKSGQFWRYLME